MLAATPTCITLPAAGVLYFQGESNADVLGSVGISAERIEELHQKGVLRRRRSPTGAFDW